MLIKFRILLICIFLFSQFVYSQTNNTTFHPFSNSYGFTLEVGGSLPKTDYKIDELSITGRILIEYFFSSKSIHAFGLRILGGAGILKGEVFSNEYVYPPVSDNFNTDFYFGGGGFIYAIDIGTGVPYFAATASYLSFNPLNENGYKLPNNQFAVYNNEAIIYSLEAGIRFPFSENWSLNLGINFNFSDTDYLDDIKAGKNKDAFISCFTGVSFYLGKEADQDNDGVEDDKDLCPDTPANNEVNEFGCSLSDLTSQETVYDTLNDHFLLDGIFSDGNLYCFQVDIFQDNNQAKELQSEIISLGYKAEIYKTNYGSRMWYSVRIGYFKSFDDAKYFRDNFFKKTNLKLN